jgi:hypothetical protein
MMQSHLEITGSGKIEIKPPVPGKRREHMIKEGNTGMD